MYSAALRHTRGDAHLAEEIAQLVFQDIARKPEIIPEGAVLAGWLYRHTCFKAAQTVRDLSRKRKRELMAAEVHTMNSETNDHWEQVAPLLDPLMQELKELDRNALVLRFLKGLDLKSVGVELGFSEDAAQKKIARALETLRGLFMQRGVPITATTLASALDLNAKVQISNAGLGALLALSGGATAYTVNSGAITGLTIKTHQAIIATLLIGGAATFVFLNQNSAFRRQPSQNAAQQQ
ncbi:MAG: RNA polymerase sigma factor, partial [Limisphaerales bacterium]